MPGVARMNDNIKQKAPHCHAPIHPAAPVPTPSPHPAQPLALVLGLCMMVKTNGKATATVTSQSKPCMLPSCVPGGPGMVAMGSMTVMVCNLPVARKGDMTAHAVCIPVIPSPVGEITEGSDDVIAGG
jgi:uncharacterized Zn-binding protein involved in type VI secretion